MTDSAACDRCAKTVKNSDDFIECMGFCDQVCHARCANLNGPFVKILREKSNLFWMCDECVKLMKFTRFKSAVASLGSVISSLMGNQINCISELKDEIVKNNKQVAQLADRVITTTPLPTRFSDRPSKRRRGELETPNKPACGARAVSHIEPLLADPKPNLFWIYLSRFHPTVNADVVEKLAREGLKTCDTVKVVSLVKKGVDPKTLNFISYKVGVPLEFKDVALSPDTWPQGIMFREFENSQAKSAVWLPPMTPAQHLTPTVERNNDEAAGPSTDTPVAFTTPIPFGSFLPVSDSTRTPATDDV